MNDKEMLKLAAKAAGMTLTLGGYLEAVREDEEGRQWNPLTDDGDALRLAVKLQIDMEFYVENGSTSAVLVEYCDYRCNIGRDEVEPKGDIYNATRRAIVHAAAEIGKKKK